MGLIKCKILQLFICLLNYATLFILNKSVSTSPCLSLSPGISCSMWISKVQRRWGPPTLVYPPTLQNKKLLSIKQSRLRIELWIVLLSNGISCYHSNRNCVQKKGMNAMKIPHWPKTGSKPVDQMSTWTEYPKQSKVGNSETEANKWRGLG